VKVAVVAGICVERDAISAVATDQVRMLTEQDGIDDVVLFAQHHDRQCAAKTVAVGDPWSFVAHPDIERSDLVIFHWGIRYDLFDALPLVAAERATAVHFHNITPVHLVAEADRPAIEASTRQIQLPLLTGSKVWADSEFNLATLREWGYPDDQIRVLPITVEARWRRRRPPRPTERVRLLTVGRLVPAKGVGVLVDAMSSVVSELDGKVSLVLAGSSELSNREYIDEITQLIRDRGLSRKITIKADLDDEALALEYERAHVLVSPSLHEGLCVPVIEAYAAGCNVVGTDAGNLPYVVQAPDPIVPAGDAAALARAIVEISRLVISGRNSPPSGAATLVANHSAEHARAELMAAVADLGPFGGDKALAGRSRHGRA
jgi:glycosyltransferase involved in cell wall biosynthesis